MSALDQLTIGEETSYAVGVAANRAFEFVSESLVGNYSQRIESKAQRPGVRALMTDHFAPNPKGAAGSIAFEVGSRQFGLLFKHMLGAFAVSGPTDTAYTQTFTMPATRLDGKSLTVQIGRAPDGAGAAIPSTNEGTKIAKWTLECDTDGLLMLATDLDAAKESTPTSPTGIYALQSWSPPAAPIELFDFRSGTLTIGGVAVGNVRKMTISGDNKLKVDNYGMRAGTNNTLKSEPRGDMPDITVSLDTEWLSQNAYAKFTAASAAGTLAAFTAVFTGAVLIGTTTYPSLTISIPNLRLDGNQANSNGSGGNDQTITGMGLWDKTNSPVSLTYVTLDATP